MADDDGVHEDGSTVFSTAEVRERIRELLQAVAIEVNGKPTLLYGFAVIAEYSTVEGHRWLAASAGDAAAHPIPYWQWESYGRELRAWGSQQPSEDGSQD